jgi:hypothetical protein
VIIVRTSEQADTDLRAGREGTRAGTHRTIAREMDRPASTVRR